MLERMQDRSPAGARLMRLHFSTNAYHSNMHPKSRKADLRFAYPAMPACMQAQLMPHLLPTCTGNSDVPPCGNVPSQVLRGKDESRQEESGTTGTSSSMAFRTAIRVQVVHMLHSTTSATLPNAQPLPEQGKKRQHGVPGGPARGVGRWRVGDAQGEDGLRSASA